jgi:ubiquinone/menaquinone biosynthesis C-methylase UbiE
MMEISAAIHLIKKGILQSDTPQCWADLGAGNGLFTQALASILPERSSILAIDKNEKAIESIEWNYKSVSLETYVGDFISLNLNKAFDGILMANALHYLGNQVEFLSRIKAMLSPAGRLIIVEYERIQPNAWVPYPINMMKLIEAGKKAGFSSIVKLEEAPSIYENAGIYSAALDF